MKARNKPHIKVNVHQQIGMQQMINKDIYIYLDDDEQQIRNTSQQLEEKLIPAIKKAIEGVKLEQ